MTEIIAAVANVSLALSFVAALVFGIAQVRAAARDRRDRLAMEALQSFQTREFSELILHVISHEMPRTDAQLRASRPQCDAA